VNFQGNHVFVQDPAPNPDLTPGRNLLSEGRLRETQSWMECVIREAPHAWEPVYLLGCVLGKQGEFERAELVLTQALELSPNAAGFVKRGNARLRLGRLESAACDYRRGAQLGASDKAAVGYECLGLLLSKRHEHSRAANFLELALRLGRNSDAVLWELGWCRYRLGRPDLCLEHWRQLYQRRPNDEALRKQLTHATYLAGIRAARDSDWKAAAGFWSECQEADTMSEEQIDTLAEVHFRAAAAGARSGDSLSGSLGHLEAAHGLCPSDVRIRYYYALLAAACGNVARALSVAGRAPPQSDPRTAFASGLFLYQAGKRDEAEARWAAILQDKPGGPWERRSRLALAAAYFRKHRRQEASKLLLQDSATLRPARQHDRALQNLLKSLAVHQIREGNWAAGAALLSSLFLLDPEKAEAAGREPDIAAATAIVFLMAGRRRQAAELCRKSQSATGFAFPVAHFLFTSQYWTALGGHPGRSARIWRDVIGNAVLMLHAGEHWADWLREREQRYRVRIKPGDLFDLHLQLERRLMNHLPITSLQGIELRVELEAARALERIGGIPSPYGEGRPLICGPSMVQELRCSHWFGRFICRLLSDE